MSDAGKKTTNGKELNVAIRLRVMPKDIETDLNGIKEQASIIISSFGRLHEAEIKPIAFGLKSLELTILVNDAAGGIQNLEEKIRGIAGVSEVETGDVTRI